jgi:hypothetical protein
MLFGAGDLPPMPDESSWNLAEGAAAGQATARERFVQRYQPVVRGYVAVRWAGTAWLTELDDAVQDVFVDLFRPEGVLSRLHQYGRVDFRALLHGVTRNVAARIEQRRAREAERRERDVDLEAAPDREEHWSRVFDRLWAEDLVRQAGRLYVQETQDQGGAVGRRSELLELRFQRGMSIQDIANTWGEDPARLHHEYGRARAGFRRALLKVIALHHAGTAAELDRECRDLLALLGSA